MAGKKRGSGGLGIGATVRFRLGLSDVTATVIEDRGPLGANGEQLWRVRLHFTDVAEPIETEIEESNLAVVEPAA